MVDNNVKTHQTKINNYVEDGRSIERRIPTSLKIFFWILLSFGIDSGFSAMAKENVKSFVKFASMAISATMIVILISSFNFMYKDIWYWTTIAEGMVYFWILNKTKYNVYDFLSDMHIMADNSTLIDNGFFGILITIYTSATFLLQTISSMYRCAYDKKLYCEKTTDEHNAIYTVAYSTIDAIPVLLIIIFYYMYCYAKYLKNSLNTNFDVEKLTKRYIAAAECCDKIGSLYDKIVNCFFFY